MVLSKSAKESNSKVKTNRRHLPFPLTHYSTAEGPGLMGRDTPEARENNHQSPLEVLMHDYEGCSHP